ncbi:alpha/beta fold hydrolase [Glycocaulis alkaliphilus]|uniref:alpha/beta fold hydrolase n=1 Tax=Glycocaulis alkaliphilus TaxID=1434191 RepID=UPI00198FFCB2|nr:alpha/beta hydrolase [Glycocaulis alkaliphilus]GGB64509.1 alpha/beta hydrolase [Glycocaulis alkaliphilus]
MSIPGTRKPVRLARASKTSWQAVRFNLTVLTACFLILTACAGGRAMPVGDDPLSPIGQFIEIDGTRLHYHVTGPEGASPVLVLHGASANLREPLMGLGEALRDERVIWLDRPGLGHSQRPSGRWNPQAEAALIAQFLEAVDAGPIIVTGHSWGGAISLRLAMDHPQAVSGIVLVAPAVRANVGEAALYNRATHWPVIGPVITRLVVPTYGRAQLESGAASAFAPDPVPEGYVEETALALLLEARVWTANAADMANVNAHLEAQEGRYGEIRQPTIILAGTEDSVVATRRHSVPVAETMRNAELVLIEGAGHAPHFAHADRVAEAIMTVRGRAAGVD